MSKVLIEDLPNYEKETDFGGHSSGAILNKDRSGLDYYKKQKINLARMDHMENEIGSIKNDISQILELLKSKR